MRKVLLLLCILSITLSANAQPGKWTKACYYDIENNKICGEIKWNVPNRNIFKGTGDQIRFRPAGIDANDKVEINKVKAFVLNADSFVVSHNAELLQYPVLRVLLDNPIKLYVALRQNSTSSAGMGGSYGGPMIIAGFYSGYDIRYFYGENPDNVTELKRGDFIEMMSKIMADNDGMVQAIKNKEYRYGKMYDLVKQYKIFKEHPVN